MSHSILQNYWRSKLDGPPAAYQGGKTRLAAQILDVVKPGDAPFFDLCCGSGAVSIEAVKRGKSPDTIHMVDAGPWGLFWQAIGNGTFDLDKLEAYCRTVPSEVALIQDHLNELARAPVNEDAVYVFLLLQAGSFGSKAIWFEEGRWQNLGFRALWRPTGEETPQARARTRHRDDRYVLPMMPMPTTIFKRTHAIAKAMYGVHGSRQNVLDVLPTVTAGTIYADPPYEDTAGYGYALDVPTIRKLARLPVWVSEGKAFADDAIRLSAGREKGGISHTRKVANAEWLSYCVPDSR